MMRKFLASVFVLFLFFGFWSQEAFSQLLLEDGKVSFTFQPGQTLNGKLRIYNTSDRQISVRAYFEDFAYIPPFDGSKSFSFFGTTPLSCSGLVSFFPEDITLAPYGRQEISYTVRFPRDAKEGYYGVLFFEDQSEYQDVDTGLNIVTRVGSLFFLERADARRSIDISDISSPRNRIQGIVKNKSQIILIPRGIFYIMNKEGMVVDRGEVEASYLPPGQEVPFFVSIDQGMADGHYALILTFDAGEGNVFVKEIDFEKTRASGLRVLGVRD